MDFPQARGRLEAALAARVFPAAVIEVGRSAGPLWTEAFGRLSHEVSAPLTTPDTIFDLASLTKVIVTTSLAMRAVVAGGLTLETRIADVLDGWSDDGRREVLVRHLLDHSSGLPAHGRLWEEAHGRDEYERVIAQLPLEHQPGTAAVYSDLGFILLGFVLETVVRCPLDEQFGEYGAAWGGIRFSPPPVWRPRTAPTEFDPWRGRLLQGEVHDENAAALDGVAGHAGAFGSAPAVGMFARAILRTFVEPTLVGTPEVMRVFARRTGVPASSRALGWDTMLLTSSCGTRMSLAAIGHTGFTGTSLWIDRERDLYVVLLTNRVYPSRTDERFAALRPLIHDAVFADLDNSRS